MNEPFICITEVHKITTDNPPRSSSGPSYESVFGDAFKSQSSTSNGYVFFGNGFSKAVSSEAYLVSY